MYDMELSGFKSSTHGLTTSIHEAGCLIPLKTTLELRAGDAMLDVYITRVPVKAANHILRLTRGLAAESSLVDLQHLRRFAKADELPQHLRSSLLPKANAVTREDVVPSIPPLYLLVGPTSSMSRDTLVGCLMEALPSTSMNDLIVCTASVPLLAPTSEAQAVSWSASHWPTVYKKSNPFGPHPSLVSRAGLEVEVSVREFMSLAVMAGASAEAAGTGASIGAVIVDRSTGVPRLVAVAADARWHGGIEEGTGNVMAHAALRAIGMVAQKLKMVDQVGVPQASNLLDHHERGMFLDKPLHDAELSVFDEPNVSSDGYLCHGLEIYLTHEPCIMCSMAILHSRFGRVVFEHRMPQTGGMCSDADAPGSPGSLGYGLFWRKELNWSLLAWQWCSDSDSPLNIDHNTNA